MSPALRGEAQRPRGQESPEAMGVWIPKRVPNRLHQKGDRLYPGLERTSRIWSKWPWQQKEPQEEGRVRKKECVRGKVPTSARQPVAQGGCWSQRGGR